MPRYTGTLGCDAGGFAKLKLARRAIVTETEIRICNTRIDSMYYSHTLMKCAILNGLLASLLISSSLAAQPATTVPSRQPKYPPKTARTLVSDEQIAIARDNIKKYPAAKAIA